MKKIVLLAAIFLILANCKTLDVKKTIGEETYKSLPDGLYANLKTGKGDILVKFYDDKSPVTVANFIGLAQGKIDNDKKKRGEPFYDGTIFHRVIENFMIQGGDALGTGLGDPGYKFDDEKNDLKHSGKGILSMANSGPNTNGSQFFITDAETPWLNGKHTVFGKVVKGENVIDSIAVVEKGSSDKPKEDIVLQQVTVFSKGSAYKNYDAEKVFNEGKEKIRERNQDFLEKSELEMQKQFSDLQQGMQRTPSGLMYKITKATNGANPKKGDNVVVHYTGKLINGNVFDSSYSRNAPITFPIGTGYVIPGWDEGLMLLKEGEQAVFIVPPKLAYGEEGAGGVIPPNASLIFEVELVKAKQ